MIEENNEELDIYKIDTHEKLNIKKIIILVLCILILLCLILIIENIIKTINGHKVFKQYEAQLQAIQYQEEQKKAEEIAKAEELEKKRLAKLPKLTEEGINNLNNIYTPEEGKKIAYLTFDDGPSAVTETILNTLSQENIKATFFMLGANVRNMPEMVKRVYDEDHYVANHGYTHVYSSIYSSPQAVLDEYNRTNDAIKEALGIPEYDPHLFRFPGGLVGGKYATIKSEAKALINQNNILNIDWNALNGDAETNNLSPEFEMQRLQETTQGKSNIVVLMHDAPYKSVTAQTLPQIISYLKEQGYEFRTFYDIIK